MTQWFCLSVCIPLIWFKLSLSWRGGCLWYSWALHLKPQTVWLFAMSWWQFKAIGKQCLVPLCASFFGNYLFLICKKAVNDILNYFEYGWPMSNYLSELIPNLLNQKICQPQWLLVSDNFSPCQIFRFPNYVWSLYKPGRSPEDVPSHPHFKVAFLSWNSSQIRTDSFVMSGFTALPWQMYLWLTWLPFWLCMIIVYLYRWWCRWQWEQCRCVWAYKLLFLN